VYGAEQSLAASGHVQAGPTGVGRDRVGKGPEQGQEPSEEQKSERAPERMLAEHRHDFGGEGRSLDDEKNDLQQVTPTDIPNQLLGHDREGFSLPGWV
jgi:hypothetical protein